MLKTTKKQLRHNKKKRETQKKKYNKVRHSKKSKTAKGHGKIKKHLNLKKRTLKKHRGGAVNPEELAAATSPELAAMHSKLKADSERIDAEKAAIEQNKEAESSVLFGKLKADNDKIKAAQDDLLASAIPELPDFEDELSLPETKSILSDEFANDEIPEETINAVADEIMEDPEIVDIDKAVESTIPLSTKKKTIKQRLSEGFQKLKGKFTRKRKPIVKGPGIPNPLFVEPIATEVVTPQASEVVTPIATEEIEMTSSNIPTERPTVAETSFGHLSPLPTDESFVEVESPTDPLSPLPTDESFVEVESPINPLSASATDEVELTSKEFQEMVDDYEATESMLEEIELDEIMSDAAEELEIPAESSAEQIQEEIKKPKNRGIFTKVAEKVKNLIGRLRFSNNKPKEAEIKANIETTLESKFPELKAEMGKLKIDADRLFEAVVTNGETTKRIFKDFNFASKIKDEQRLREISMMLDAFRHEVLSDTIDNLNRDNQLQMTSLNARIEQLLAQNETLKSGLSVLSEKAEQEEPVIVEKVTTGMSEDDIKKIAAVLATDNEQKLIDIAADNGELRQQISELVEMSRDLALQVQHLKTMRQSESIEPWVYVENVPPQYAEVAQPQTTVQQPVAQQETTVKQQKTTVQPVAQQETTVIPTKPTTTQPESEQVISISPEQLLDNKTIVIKIMMPRAAQINTASDTGNTAAEQITSMVTVDKPTVLSKKDQEIMDAATKLREEQEIMDAPPPPYSEKGGNKSINPAIVHPASLFNN